MEFINRKAQYPGRVKLVKVSDSTDLYDMTLADGIVGEGYNEGTPLNADTFNAMLEEISTEIKNSLLKSIRLYDGTNYGTKLSIGDSKDIVVKLPTTIKANLSGTADTAKELEDTYGKVITKRVYLSTSYTTVYTATTGTALILFMSPDDSSAKNTAVFAGSYANGSTSIDDVNYVNKSGYINKKWNGKNFQISMSKSDAKGYYSITIIEAHY